MGRRSERFEIRRKQQSETRAVNRPKKMRERARREARMIARIRTGEPPYSPEVMSWLSRRLDKPASRITPEDIQRVAS